MVNGTEGTSLTVGRDGIVTPCVGGIWVQKEGEIWPETFGV